MSAPYGKKINMIVTETSHGQLDKRTATFTPIKEDFDRPAYVVEKAIHVFLNRKYITEQAIIDLLLYRNDRLAKDMAWRALTHNRDWKKLANGLLEEEKNGVHTNPD